MLFVRSSRISGSGTLKLCRPDLQCRLPALPAMGRAEVQAIKEKVRCRFRAVAPLARQRTPREHFGFMGKLFKSVAEPAGCHWLRSRNPLSICFFFFVFCYVTSLLLGVGVVCAQTILRAYVCRLQLTYNRV